MTLFAIIALRDTLHALSELIHKVTTSCQVVLQVTYHISRLLILPMPSILCILSLVISSVPNELFAKLLPQTQLHQWLHIGCSTAHLAKIENVLMLVADSQ